jgi:uncharacterized protein YjiS (DUF1127 family)
MDHLLPRRAKAGYHITAGRRAKGILKALARSLERSRQRRALAQLSDDLLRDIGLTRHDIASEVSKPFWRV